MPLMKINGCQVSHLRRNILGGVFLRVMTRRIILGGAFLLVMKCEQDISEASKLP